MTEQQLIDQGYKEGQKSFEYLAQGVLDNFDFEKVYQVMKLLDWTWCFQDNEEYEKQSFGIPNPTTLKIRVLELLKTAYDNKRGVSSAGFCIEYDNGDLEIAFVIEAFHTSDLNA